MAQKPVQPYEHDGFAIINPYGAIWGPDIFPDKEFAARYLDQFWGGREKWQRSGYAVAPARSVVTVTGPERVKLP